jgi:hypothetical protein
VLKNWLTIRRGELISVGKASRAYVERWHDPMKIALMMKQDYEAVMREKSGMPN